ncbi:MAG: single-stranded-DNA-specific exonuclease RecJ [Balneolaceae bacterium]|nr:MAG: single-stranded-DNA-specific exonuclease RecJ [Balneolaceae bacterium]
MPYRWVYPEPLKEEALSALQAQLNIPREIARLLAQRNITGFDQAKSFFRPDFNDLYDPFLMKDMEKAATRLSSAIRNREKVVIYGDYDVDGTTAVSILHLFLQSFGLDVEYYIPHRFKEGYGINHDGIHFAMDRKADLIVSVDCGITAVDEAAYVKEQGIDLIICDHHTVGDQLPDAVAVLDPKRPDCNYPFEGLSGAGVGFKLVQATTQKLGLPNTITDSYLDLVAISIASDIVPIVDENRILMRRGLEQINSQPRTGIKALLKLINSRAGSVSTTQIVFSIGPRINAAGRMGDATTAVELLISDDETKAARYAKQLEEINLRRRDTDSETMTQAVEMLEQEHNLKEISAMVLHHPEWHLGVIGIVASRLVDAHYRPAIMLSTVEGKIKGSARSIKGFNIYDALKECEDLLEQYGGHEFAAGLTMVKENLEEFRTRMNSIACRMLAENDFQPELEIAADLELNLIDMKFWKLLTQFEPFGPGNPRPVFVSRNVCIEGVPAIVGNGHLKMRIRQNGSAVFDAIGFNMHGYEPNLRNCKHEKVDVAYVLEENFWNGKRTIQMRLKDIKVESQG